MSAGGDGAGMLVVQMEPPPAMEEEFNAWYDSEHVPEREAVPGFLNAARYVCVTGWPRYVACYDLTRLKVLEEPAYQSIGAENMSPWSKRVLARVVGRRRLELRRVDGSADSVAPGNGKVLLLLAGCEGEPLIAIAEALGKDAPAATVRLFDNVLAPGERVIMLDASSLALIPDWSPRELSDAAGGEGGRLGSLIGSWRYERYRR